MMVIDMEGRRGEKGAEARALKTASRTHRQMAGQKTGEVGEGTEERVGGEVEEGPRWREEGSVRVLYSESCAVQSQSEVGHERMSRHSIATV